MMHRVAISLAIGLGMAVAPAVGRPVTAPVSYRSAMFRDVRFLQRVRSDLRIYTGIASRSESTGREGVWQVRADSNLALEAWFDSLVVWRDTREGKLTPDTDGLIGGRYRGTLGPDGRYVSQTSPFIPGPVAEVTDLSMALNELFPRLSPDRLSAGEEFADTTGWKIRRLSDSSAGGVPLQRYRWTISANTTRATAGEDSLFADVHERTTEDGTLVWHEVSGPLRWDRHIVVDVTVPASGAVKRGLRSRLEQRVSVWRL